MCPACRFIVFVLVLKRVLRCMVQPEEKLIAYIWTDSDAGIDFRIAQLRTSRTVFHPRLIEYGEHDDCAACHVASLGPD